jgi:hypothetical protein
MPSFSLPVRHDPFADPREMTTEGSRQAPKAGGVPSGERRAGLDINAASVVLYFESLNLARRRVRWMPRAVFERGARNLGFSLVSTGVDLGFSPVSTASVETTGVDLTAA